MSGSIPSRGRSIEIRDESSGQPNSSNHQAESQVDSLIRRASNIGTTRSVPVRKFSIERINIQAKNIANESKSTLGFKGQSDVYAELAKSYALAKNDLLNKSKTPDFVSTLIESSDGDFRKASNLVNEHKLAVEDFDLKSNQCVNLVALKLAQQRSQDELGLTPQVQSESGLEQLMMQTFSVKDL